MVSHLRMDYLPCGLRDDHIGLLDGHVAANALVDDFVPPLLRNATTLPTVAAQALLRIRFSRLPGAVHVVTGRATHLLRGSVALASLEETDLVSVNVRVLGFGRWKSLEVFAERPSGNVGESGSQSDSLNSVMAFSAQINLPVPRKFYWVQNAVDRRVAWLGSFFRFKPNMICSRAVAVFA